MFDYNEYEKRISDLFSRWCDAHRTEKSCQETKLPDIEQKSFIRDGVVSDNYDGVLFIMKEANILKHRGSEEPSARTQLKWYQDYYTKGMGDNRPKQLEKIARMYLALSRITGQEHVNHALGRVAIMNLNKRGGGNKEDTHVLAYTKQYKEFILEQIRIMEPEKIIVLGTDNILTKAIPELNKKYPIIPMWHTAYTRSPKQGYINVENYISEFKKRLDTKPRPDGDN